MAVKIDGTIKKRVQSLMALNGQSYEEVIDRLLKKELERKKGTNE